ncbi:uncharacterized protein LOC126570350 [Anopheles aquasalis]|uniref:uncharacterized protein LOC126570350 n=1 Tax=Anopheles aquasalis TaxID=42839 RepID=UPI00215A8B9F|nr:uncharacterized protein LOC126570350 [Anopheles aquasalis]
MTLFKLVLRLVLRYVPTPSVAVVIVLLLLLSPRIRHKVGAVHQPSPPEDTGGGDDGSGSDASWLLHCDQADTVEPEAAERTWEPPNTPPDCRIPITVNYRSLDTEFSVELNCTQPPSSSEYSRKMFRKVQSYRMGGRSAHGAGLGLSYLHYPENVRLLALDGYCLATVPPSTFTHFHRLDRLELVNGSIRLLTPGSFQGLATLKELRFIRCQFERMDAGVLRELTQLEQLIVDGSGTLNFTIGPLEALETFKLVDSRVTNLTALVEHLPAALQRLQFVYVRTGGGAPTASTIVIDGSSAGTGTGTGTGVPSGLVKAALVNCTLRYASVRNLPALITLNLSQNALDERTLVLSHLPSLQLLVLSENALGEIPAGLFAVGSTTLATVDLSANRITYIHPGAFGDVGSSIVRLDIRDNRLLSLDYDIGDWPRLVAIRADRNPWDCVWLRDSGLFERFEYTHARDDRLLSVSGLPCNLPTLLVIEPAPAASTLSSPADDDHPEQNGTAAEPVDEDDHGDHDAIVVVHARPKVTVTVPVEPPVRALTIIVLVIVGFLVSNVCLLVYNRYRRAQHVPFYRTTAAPATAGNKAPRLQSGRCRGACVACCVAYWCCLGAQGIHGDGDDELDEAMTEKSTSFLYELPIECQPSCSYAPAHTTNIYEEIVEVEPTPGTQPPGYDVLQFEVHQVRYTVPDHEPNATVYV